MPAFNFPNAPAVGDTSNGYTWDGKTWTPLAQSPIMANIGNLGPTLQASDFLIGVSANVLARFPAGTSGQFLAMDTSSPAKPVWTDTITKSMVISVPVVGGVLPQLSLDKPASGQWSQLMGSMAGKGRWIIALGNGTAESGSNVGSDFALFRANDAGATIDAPITIARNSGNISCNTQTVYWGTPFSAATYLNTTAASSQIGFWAGALFNYDVASGNYTLQTSGGVRWTSRNSDGAFIIPVKGYQPGGGSWADSSDIRIKDVHGSYDSGLAAINALKPVRYSFKGNDGEMHAQVRGIEYIGLVAQEAEESMPELISKHKHIIDDEVVDDYRVLDPAPLVFALINAVKELSREVESLKRQINR